MSRQAGSIVRGNFKAAPDIRLQQGQQQVAGIYCQLGKRSRYEGRRGATIACSRPPGPQPAIEPPKAPFPVAAQFAGT